MKIGFFGDGPWAHGSFDKLSNLSWASLSFVCARHEVPDVHLKSRAHKAKIPFFSVADINSSDFLGELDKFKCDLFVSMSFDQIFRRRVLRIPKLGTINCHAGKLPNYRGRNVLNWALINDETEFGVTVHFVDEGVDSGDIIVQTVHQIEDTDTYGSLLEKAYESCPEAVISAVEQIQSQTFVRTPQTGILEHPIICSRRVPGDEEINWNDNSRDIFNFVRALSEPGPIARTKLDGRTVYIRKVRFIPSAPKYRGIPGAVLARSKDSFLVKTGDTYVEVLDFSSTADLRPGRRLG